MHDALGTETSGNHWQQISTSEKELCVGLVLKVFLALLPWLLSILGRIQGLHSQSSIDFSVISKFYIFQVRSSTCCLD